MKAKKLVRDVLWAVLLSLGVAGCVPSRAAWAQPRITGPDAEKMTGLVGDWTSEGEAVASPLGPAATQSITIKGKWFPGGFAVVRHLDGKKSLSGEYHGLQILTYDK